MLLQLRVTVPPDRTDHVWDLVEHRPGTAHLAVLPGASVTPPGDLVLADVARESADGLLSALRRLGAGGAHDDMAVSLARAGGSGVAGAATQLAVNLTGILVAAAATLAVQRTVRHRIPGAVPRGAGAQPTAGAAGPMVSQAFEPGQDRQRRMEDHVPVTDATRSAPPRTTQSARRGLLLIGVAIVLTGLNLRTAVNSVGPVLEELETGLHLSSGLAGLVTSLPVLCFAALGFAGPPLSARFRDAHVLAGALLGMAAGLVLRSLVHSFPLFLAGSVLAMIGGALGNVLLPSLVKRYFPHRTGLLVGAYSTALSLGGAVAAVITQPIADSLGADGWRWALAVWAIPALVAALAWLVVPRSPGATRGSHAAVPMRALVHSPLAIALTFFFGLQSIQAYVIIGWLAQYLRDAGMAATTAGLMLGINSVVVIPVYMVVPVITVQPRRQWPLLLFFMACYTAGWIGLWAAPLTGTLLWACLLGVGMGTFAMVLTLIGLRARTPETTAALSTVTQGWGYVVAAGGPLLVGVLRGVTGGYTGMFVLVLACVAGLIALGWIVTRDRYVDDEVERSVPGWSSGAAPRGEDSASEDDEVLEAAGEAPVSMHLRPDGGSPRG